MNPTSSTVERAPVVAVRGATCPSNGTLALLGAGHFVVDLCQGVLPLLLPFLFEKLQLDYTATAAVITIAYVTSSIAQPAFGLLNRPALRNLAIVLAAPFACTGIVLVALAPSYGLMLGAVVLSSLGTAMYHPEAAARVHAAAGADVGRSMSMFVLCGSIGFTTGAMIFGPLLAAWGMAATRLLLVPGVLITGLLVFHRQQTGATKTGPALERLSPRAVIERMSVPVGVMALRQWVVAGMIALVPLYYVTHLHAAPAVGGMMLFALQLGSNCGVFACGILGRKIGHKRMVIGGLLAAIPFLLLFSRVGGAWAAVLLFCGGAALAPSMPGLTIIAQALLPGRHALAASLIMGVGVGLGGIASASLGWMADHWGMPAALAAVGVMPMAAALLALGLPAGVPATSTAAAGGKPVV